MLYKKVVLSPEIIRNLLNIKKSLLENMVLLKVIQGDYSERWQILNRAVNHFNSLVHSSDQINFNREYLPAKIASPKEVMKQEKKTLSIEEEINLINKKIAEL